MDINNKTNISLFAVLASAPVILGALVWLTAIDAKASAAKDDLMLTREMLNIVNHQLTEMNTRLGRIEGAIKQK